MMKIYSSVIRDMLEFGLMKKNPNNGIFDREQIKVIIQFLYTEY